MARRRIRDAARDSLAVSAISLVGSVGVTALLWAVSSALSRWLPEWLR